MTKFGTLMPDGKIKNSMEIDLDKVKSDDPIAYSYGLFHGKTGQGLPKDETDLAKEYIRGYKNGIKEWGEEGGLSDEEVLDILEKEFKEYGDRKK